MKTLILSLMMVMSQTSFAVGNQGGTLDSSSVGSLKSADNGSVGTMGGNEVGNFKSASIGFGNMGNGFGTMDNSCVGTLSIAGGAEANGNGQGNKKLVGGAEANGSSSGGGVGPKPKKTTTPSGHEV
jgi:hypothetical protein